MSGNAPGTPAPRARTRGRFRRWLRRIAIVVIGFAIALRVATPWLLAWIADGQAGALGLTCRWHSLSLGVLAGEMRVQGLEVHARGADGEPSGDALLRVDLLGVDLRTTALLGGEFDFSLAELDGVDLRVERDAAGRWVWAEHVPAPGAPTGPEASPQEAATAAFDFRLPFSIDLLRAQHVRVHVVDRTDAPALDTWVETNLRVNDLGRADRLGRIELHAHGPALLDELALDGTLTAGVRALDARFEFRLRGLRLGPLDPLLAPLGITANANRIDGGFQIGVAATPSAGDDRAIDLRVALERFALRADDVDGLALGSVDAHANGLRIESPRIDAIELRGFRARAERLADGALAALGVAWRPVARPAAADATPAAALPPRTARPFELKALRLDDARFDLIDRAVATDAPLAVVVDSLAVSDVVLDAARPDARARIDVQLRAPGVAERVTLQAQVVPFATRRAVDAELRAEHVTLVAIAPYLRRAGFEPDLRDGVLALKLAADARTDLEGDLRVDVALGPLTFVDGERALAGLEGLRVQGVILDKRRTRLRIGEVDVTGVAFGVRADADGGLHVAGLRRVPGASGAVSTALPAIDPVVTPKVPPKVPLRIELGMLRARGTRVSFADESLDPPLAFAPDEIELDVRDLAFGGAADGGGGTEGEEAQLRARIVAPSIADELAMTGSIRSRPGPLDAELRVELVGNRIVAGPFAPWLERAGLQSTLRAGRFRGVLTANARAHAGGGVIASAKLAGLTVADGDEPPFLALDEARLDDVVVASGGIDVGHAVVQRPRLSVARDADGSLLACGLRMVPRIATGDASAPSIAVPPDLATAFRWSLGEASLTGMRIDWRDLAVAPEVATVLALDAHATGITNAADAEAGRFDASLRAEGSVDALTLAGALRLCPDDLRATLALRGSGLRAGPLAAYVPQGTTVELQDGRLAVDAEFTLARAQDGGHSLTAAIRSLALREGAADAPALLALDELSVRAPRLDAAGGRVAIDAITSRGLELDVRRRADGTLALLGVALRRAEPPVGDVLPGDAPANAAASAATSFAASASTPPRVTLERLDLGVARLRFVDETAGAPAAPLDARLRLFSEAPLVLLDAQPEALPPSAFVVEGAATPLLDALRIDLEVAPWQPDAKLVAKLSANGLNGPRLGEVFPALRERIDASAIAAGTVRGELELLVDLVRRTPTDVDLARGYGLDLDVRGLELRAAPAGEVLAGIASAGLEAPRIVPGGVVRIGTIDVAGITGRATKDARGLTLAGVTLLAPPADVVPQAPAVATGAPSRREVRIDELSLRGLDFVYRDVTCDPPMTIPLEGLDVEVRDFTTRTFTDGVPFRFTGSLSAGKVDLPERIRASSLVAGVLGAALGAVTGQGDARQIESRPMLDEIAVDGRLAFGPQLDGRVRASVNGLELGAFRGPAKQSGIEIGDGVLDAGATLYFHGANGVRTDANFAFNSLSLSEPPGGPIATFLKLPAPLDTVLFALRDNNADIRIPLDVRTSDGSVSGGQIAAATITALSAVIAKALATAPLRAAGAITGLLGIGGGDAQALAEQAVDVGFGLGDFALAETERIRLRALADLCRGDESIGLVLVHAFGAGDLARAATLANPSRDQVEAIAERLRRELAREQRTRDEALAELRAVIGAGEFRTAWLQNRHVQELDARIAQSGDALDRVVALLRTGAERRADRRTRDAAIELGNARLAATRLLLLDLCGVAPDSPLAQRIEVRPARTGDPIGADGGKVTVTPRVRPAPTDPSQRVTSTLSDGALPSPPTRGRSSVVER